VSDDQRLESVARGDRRALEELYLGYRRRLTSFLSRLAPHSENIDEIINDTFMIVWQHAGEFRRASRVSTWIYGIAYRVALKSLRQHKRWRAASADGQPEQVTNPTQQTEECDWLTQGLGLLSQEQWLGLMLTYHWGHSLREVAAMTHSPLGTVKARLFHARKRLRLHLSELRGEPAASAPARAAGKSLASSPASCARTRRYPKSLHHRTTYPMRAWRSS
jgi:RNA polymerase sigma-70 factor, ECF subfamily